MAEDERSGQGKSAGRHPRRPFRSFSALAPVLLLPACGGGGVNSTPAPTPAPAPTPSPTAAYDTAEYRRSSGPVAHGAITAYAAGASGAGVTVGIIDSGIATGNSEFAGRISPASADFAGNGSIEDAGGHGTAVSTVLAAARDGRFVLGMAWGATILALRTDTPGSCTGTVTTEGSSCSHTTSAIVRALDYARTNGARVVNISLGGAAATSDLVAAVDRATSAGIVIVVSAGNDGTAAPDALPASLALPSVGHGLVVIAGSVNAAGQKSSFSDGAQGYEAQTLFALGENVLSQDQTGAQFIYGGTSFSAPQIAGAAALLAQAFPTLTGAQIVDLLLSRAKDAGVTGTDAVYGRGILDVAAAFAPAGQTSLAGSGTAVSLTNGGMLSSAFGDASAQASPMAVAVDSLGRAYAFNIAGSLRQAAPTPSLGLAMGERHRAFAVEGGPLSLSLGFAQGLPTANIGGAAALPDPRLQPGRPMSGDLSIALGGGTRVGLAFTRWGTASSSTGVARGGSFLVAREGSGQWGFVARDSRAMRVEQALPGGTTLFASVGQGRVSDADPFAGVDPRNAGHDRYASAALGVTRRFGALGLSANLGWLAEDGTLLGARFGPAIGARAGRSLFLDMAASLDLPAGWALGLSARRGWTRAADTRLRSGAWSLDLMRDGAFAHGDRLAFRFAQPLRISGGGIGLDLPTAYDYASGTARWTRERIGLAPRGRELDAELSYALRLGPGQVDANAFWRREPGNIAGYPDDPGVAVRYAIGF